MKKRSNALDRFSSRKAPCRSRSAARDIPKNFRKSEMKIGAQDRSGTTKNDTRASSLVYIRVLHDLFHQSDHLRAGPWLLRLSSPFYPEKGNCWRVGWW